MLSSDSFSRGVSLEKGILTLKESLAELKTRRFDFQDHYESDIGITEFLSGHLCNDLKKCAGISF